MKIYCFFLLLAGTVQVCFTCTFVHTPNVFKCLNCLKSLASKVFGKSRFTSHFCVFLSSNLGTSQEIFIMVPWLLVFSECYNVQDSFESMQNFHSSQSGKN